MTLYAADLETLSTPVNSTAPAEKPVKGRKKKVTIEAPPTPEPTPEPTPTPKEKKPLTEKQQAALAKMQETRKRKREEKLQAETEAAEKEAIAAKEKEIAEKEKELKKAEQAEKRKKKRLEKKTSKSDSIDEVVDKEAEAVNVASKSSDEPPKWFKKYIEGVAVEQNALKKEKQPKMEVKRLAGEVAQKSWQDGHTRDRVQTEVDAHMDRMYQMMFSRKLK